MFLNHNSKPWQHSQKHANDSNPSNNVEDNTNFFNILKLFRSIWVKSGYFHTCHNLSLTNSLQQPRNIDFFNGNNSIDKTFSDIDDNNNIIILIVTID